MGNLGLNLQYQYQNNIVVQILSASLYVVFQEKILTETLYGRIKSRTNLRKGCRIESENLGNVEEIQLNCKSTASRGLCLAGTPV